MPIYIVSATTYIIALHYDYYYNDVLPRLIGLVSLILLVLLLRLLFLLRLLLLLLATTTCYLLLIRIITINAILSIAIITT